MVRGDSVASILSGLTVLTKDETALSGAGGCGSLIVAAPT